MLSLSSLPPELLRGIIESTVPHSYHSTTYEERQSTLCSLSLVSRTFRAIAQPLLFEIVSIDMDEQLESFLEGRSDILESKEVIVGYYVSFEGFRKLLSRSRGLQSLSIARERRDPVGLEVLLEHTKLVNLQLYGPRGFDFTVRGAFTSLRALTLDDEALSSSVRLTRNPEVLPELQALGLRGVTNVERLQRLKETSLSRLLPQLNTIIIHSDLYRLGIDDIFSGYSSRILVDVNYWTFDSPTLLRSLTSAQHVRIKASETYTLETSARILALLAAYRESGKSSLKSIYLPLEWHPSRFQLAGSSIEMQRVMEECKKAGTELVFESQPKSWIDHHISREFWDRQRRRRQEE